MLQLGQLFTDAVKNARVWSLFYLLTNTEFSNIKSSSNSTSSSCWRLQISLYPCCKWTCFFFSLRNCADRAKLSTYIKRRKPGDLKRTLTTDDSVPFRFYQMQRFGSNSLQARKKSGSVRVRFFHSLVWLRFESVLYGFRTQNDVVISGDSLYVSSCCTCRFSTAMKPLIHATSNSALKGWYVTHFEQTWTLTCEKWLNSVQGGPKK